MSLQQTSLPSNGGVGHPTSPAGANEGWRIARNTLVQLAGRGVTMALSVVTLTVLARSLGAEGVGGYLLVLSLLTLFNLSDMGFTTIAMRELSVAGDHAILLGNIILVRVAMSLVALAVICSVALILNYGPQLTAAVCLGSLSFLLLALGQGTFGLVFATSLRMEYQSIANVAQALVFLLTAAAAVTLDLGIVAVVLAYDFSILVASTIVIYFSRRFLRPVFRIDLALCRRLLRDTAPVAIGFVMWLAYNRIDMVLLSKLAGAESLGLYGMAYRFVDLSAPIGLYFTLSVYPLLTRYYSEGRSDHVRALAQRALNALAIFVFPLAAVIVVFPETLLAVVGSAEFEPAATSLRLLSLAIIAIWLSGITSHLLMAMGKQGILFRILPFALVMNVGLNLVLIPELGYNGAALVTALTEVVVLAYSMLLLWRMAFLPSFQSPLRIALVAGAGAAVTLFATPDILPLRAAVLVAMLTGGAITARVVSLDDVTMLSSKLQNLARLSSRARPEARSQPAPSIPAK